LLRTRFVRGISIAVGLLLTTAPYASAQSVPAGDAAHGPRSPKDAPSATSGADIWDANHDGVYTCGEWKSYLDRLFTLADRNRDGHLDPSEFKVIRRAGATFADADFGYFDENQDGKITRSEFVDKPSEFILKFDKNGDCRVTQDEMKGASTDQKPTNGRGKKF
jgi:Ca2+-binding EF-hand superfamily protein